MSIEYDDEGNAKCPICGNCVPGGVLRKIEDGTDKCDQCEFSVDYDQYCPDDEYEAAVEDAAGAYYSAMDDEAWEEKEP